MQRDQRIWHLAQAVLEKHGDESLAVVTARVRDWHDARDYEWVAVWAEVAQDICEMRANARKPYPTHLELMDDP